MAVQADYETGATSLLNFHSFVILQHMISAHVGVRVGSKMLPTLSPNLPENHALPGKAEFGLYKA